MTNAEAKRWAFNYLYESSLLDGPAIEWMLTRQFSWRMDEACDRLRKKFGEVTRKDIALLVESWCVRQEGADQVRPLIRVAMTDCEE